ncbi:MAG: hypothetical protein GY861_11045 [bacterium]|nr:hypothetical protein [bacterium]
MNLRAMEHTIANPDKSDKIIKAGITVCFTGKIEKYTRDELKVKLRARGIKVAPVVTKNIDYLVTGTIRGTTTLKKTKAEHLGIKTLTEKRFWEEYE